LHANATQPDIPLGIEIKQNTPVNSQQTTSQSDIVSSVIVKNNSSLQEIVLCNTAEGMWPLTDELCNAINIKNEKN